MVANSKDKLLQFNSLVVTVIIPVMNTLAARIAAFLALGALLSG